LLLIFTLLGLVGPVVFVFATASVLAGIGLFGSNKRTRDDALAKIKTLETERSEIIDGLELRSAT
jgi:hypothetical protein